MDMQWKLPSWSTVGLHEIFDGAVKCIEIRKSTNGGSTLLGQRSTERRWLGEQMGLETPVVLAIKDGYQVLVILLRALIEQQTEREILFPYDFK
jgi:hypothetical protein